MAESSGSVVANMSEYHIHLPLNLTSITAGQLRRLGLALGIQLMTRG